MPKMIDLETKIQAKEIFVIDGKTIPEISEITGVSETQLQRWSSEEKWADERRQYRLAIADINRKKILLTQELISGAIDSKDPQMVYAATRMLSAIEKKRATNNEGRPEADRPKIFLELMEFIAKHLKDHDETAFKYFATNFDQIVEAWKSENIN